MLNCMSNCFFHDNNATALAINNTSITLSGNTEFIHNRACGDIIVGGAIIVLDSNLTVTGNTTFLDNSATVGYCKFGFGVSYGGAIFTTGNTVLSFNGINNFINNSASDGGGGAICTLNNTVLRFSGTNSFINNSAYAGGAIATDNTVFASSGTTHFINNSAFVGGAIYTSCNSTLTFNGTIYFTNNGHYEGGVNILYEGTKGGGVYMRLKSTFFILPNTTVYWENNHANLGGAIYVEDANPLSYCRSVAKLVPKEECFFQLPGQNLSNGIDVQLVFKNNSADVAGSVLYGGAIDNCKLNHGLDSHHSGEVFDMIVHNNDTDYNTTSNISSDPLQICLCKHNLPDCSESIYIMPRTVYPGETFQVSVVAVGQRRGTVPSRVVSIIDQGFHPGHLPDSQHLQQANNMCTKLNYTVFSLFQEVQIQLHADDSPCSVVFATDMSLLYITVSLNQNCPPGLHISEMEKSCVCEPRLAHIYW